MEDTALAKMSTELLTAEISIMCLRGSRSACHRPDSPSSGDAIDLACAEGRVPHEI